MCSLKETGFRGKHKCGVTLLSGGNSIQLNHGFMALDVSISFNSATGKMNETLYENKTYYYAHKDDPTIFVGAAHCNFICKDFTDPQHPLALETCCCLPEQLSTSCKKGSRVSLKLQLCCPFHITRSCF